MRGGDKAIMKTLIKKMSNRPIVLIPVDVASTDAVMKSYMCGCICTCKAGDTLGAASGASSNATGSSTSS